jgi:hypothetical protein
MLPFLGAVLNRARQETVSNLQKDAAVSNQTNKDDIARLIHLFKEPGAQVHWTNLNGILNREQLDARRSTGPQSEAANPLAYLAEMFNDYNNFTPQNLMVRYISSGSGRPVKVSPFQPSSDEWAALANYTHDIDPCNVSRKAVLRDEAWIKSSWADCRKYLHQAFVQYNRSGQHDSEMDDWCSPKEIDRWVRATTYKTAGQTIIRFPTVMMYSICVLDQSDLEGIGRRMPKDVATDTSMGSNSKAIAKRKKKQKKSTTNKSLVKAMNDGTKREEKIAALRSLLEFGSARDKADAVKELRKVAFGKKSNSTASIDDSDNSEHSANESAESSKNSSFDSASGA